MSIEPEIEAALKLGLPRQRAAWDQYGRERAYYLNQGHRLIPSRESEQSLDKQMRPKLGLHAVNRIISELAKGLYAHPGPARKVHDQPAADLLVQSVSREHRVNRVLHKVDSYTYLHGVCAVQVVPYVDVVHRRRTGETVLKDPACPVTFRTWPADQFACWVDDADPSFPVAVVTRSYVAGRERLQLWTDDEVRTYLARNPLVPYNAYAPDRYELDRASSGENQFGVIPFEFAHNDDPCDEFWTPGLGYTLTNTCHYLDQVLSDLTQSCEVFCVPEKYSRNLSVANRLVHRPGDPMDLIERDPSREADVFYRQPDLQVESIWLHIENTLNESLIGLDVPIQVQVQTMSNPESGVALIVRRAPLLDRWRVRQDMFSHFEACLWRTACRVAAIALGDATLLAESDRLALEVDYPEYSFPIPSLEKDQSDQWELDHGVKSRVQVVQERFGKTRPQAIEHLRQVAEDEAIATALAGAPAVPLRITAYPDREPGIGPDVEGLDVSASAARPQLASTGYSAPGRLPAMPPEAASDPAPAITATSNV